jgi:hypothetical protein
LKPGIRTELYTVALARAQWTANNNAVYFDRPNVLAYHRYPRIGSSGGLVLEEAFDIVDNDVAVSPDAARSSFQVRLEQGVLDTNAEAAIAGNGRAVVANTANAYAEASAPSSEWLTIEKENSPDWRGVHLPSKVLSLAINDVRNGYTVIIPKTLTRKCPAGCWWRIDPRTGNTLGVGDRGWGQTATEHALTITAESKTITELIWIQLGFEFCAACHGIHLFCLGVLGGDAAAGWLSWITEFEHGPLLLFIGILIESTMIAAEGSRKRPVPCVWNEPPGGEPEGNDGPSQSVAPSPTPTRKPPSGPPWHPKPGSTPPPQQPCDTVHACPPLSAPPK